MDNNFVKKLENLSYDDYKMMSKSELNNFCNKGLVLVLGGMQDVFKKLTLGLE